MSLNENASTVQSEIVDAFSRIRSEIDEAARLNGRNASEITLIAVSKTKPESALDAAMFAGQLHFGENKMLDLEDRMKQPGREHCIWHMIGTLQSNKIKFIAPRVNWIHSAAKVAHLEEIEKQAARFNRKINVLIQVNVSGEEQKSGCQPEELGAILEVASSFSGAQVRGLMGMAEFTDDEKTVRAQFKKLRDLRDFWKSQVAGKLDFQHLSMGMTHDFKWAVAEGATLLRIGSALFGSR